MKAFGYLTILITKWSLFGLQWWMCVYLFCYWFCTCFLLYCGKEIDVCTSRTAAKSLVTSLDVRRPKSGHSSGLLFLIHTLMNKIVGSTVARRCWCHIRRHFEWHWLIISKARDKSKTSLYSPWNSEKCGAKQHPSPKPLASPPEIKLQRCRDYQLYSTSARTEDIGL